MSVSTGEQSLLSDPHGASSHGLLVQLPPWSSSHLPQAPTLHGFSPVLPGCHFSLADLLPHFTSLIPTFKLVCTASSTFGYPRRKVLGSLSPLTVCQHSPGAGNCPAEGWIALHQSPHYEQYMVKRIFVYKCCLQ